MMNHTWIQPDGAQRPCKLTPRQPVSKVLWGAFALSLFLTLTSGFAYAQAAAEYGAGMSGIATSISGTNLMKNIQVPNLPTGNSTNQSAVIMSQPTSNPNVNPKYIFESMKQGSVTENRQLLEESAGKDAAKLMLRSNPTDAFVKVNGKAVGRTPILLVVPPGQYDVTLDGKRMEHADQKIDLLPKETREFLIPLKQQFPTEVMIHLH